MRNLLIVILLGTLGATGTLAGCSARMPYNFKPDVAAADEDAGEHGDMGATCGAVDMLAARDLARPADLASPRDLARPDLAPVTCTIADPWVTASELAGLPYDGKCTPYNDKRCFKVCAPGTSPGLISKFYARRLPSDDLLTWTTLARSEFFDVVAHDVGILPTGGSCGTDGPASRFLRMRPIYPQPWQSTRPSWYGTPSLGGPQGAQCPQPISPIVVWGSYQIIYEAL